MTDADTARIESEATEAAERDDSMAACPYPPASEEARCWAVAYLLATPLAKSSTLPRDMLLAFVREVVGA